MPAHRRSDRRALAAAVAVALSLIAAPAAAQPAALDDAGAVFQERQCQSRGWQRLVTQFQGLSRPLLWKAPPGPWRKGVILVLHGGGGRHFQWCVANAPAVRSQVEFSELAVAEGFAVVLLDSTDRVTDREGRACGKVWDDEVRDRPNLDLPYLGHLMRERLHGLRPAGSRQEVFITGLSSGGYMTVRAATHFDDLVTAFAPVSSGDPYGWHRLCIAGMNARTEVHGGGFDNETKRQIPEPGACLASGYPNEQPWDSARPAVKPAFRVFRHEHDGVNDASCSEKVSRQLREHGYRGEPDFVLRRGRRGVAQHLWQGDYSRPVLDFFAAQLGAPR